MVSPSQAFARRSYECRTPRLLIRTPTSVDEEVYNTLSTDQKHYPYEKAETELARETITEFIKNMPNYSSAGAAAFFVIELRETTDIGITIDHKHWRKGYGVEAFCGLVEFAHRELGCKLFRVETGLTNEPWVDWAKARRAMVETGKWPLPSA
ncbi:hypothetical protein V2G26_006972 [Clonostachys chloroleuca]